ncbi:lipopolysaccharide biosynthesis protein [Chromobacterium amazonense]|uniref:Oligosaccharide flippase family protein n=1 Tax=Chromobacterium amazonense TaxID=1382803 RepID=A0ABU8V2U2_9NEIS|nr:oligosaccharide flippase family protein [Chromobacterium amazonense]MDQ4542228.1 oligosaccharide flippase family protein [Chromobacterium amazonense]
MSFLRAGAIYVVANVASAAVPFMLLPFLTRLLTPAQYGEVVSFALLVTLCMTVAGLNAHAAIGVMWFRKSPEQVPSITATALAIAVASTLMVAVLLMMGVHFFPNMLPSITPIWAAAAALTAGSNVVLQCRLVLLQGKNLPVSNAILQIAASVLNVTLSMLAVIVFNLGSAGRNGGIALAALIMACTATTLFLRSRELEWSPTREQVTTLMNFGLPLVLHSFAGVLISTADRWTIGLKLGSYELGVYGAGAQLGMVMSILADAFVKAYGPWLYARLKADTKTDKLRATGAIYVATPALACVASGVGVVLYLVSGILLGAKYHAAAMVLPWFMLGGALNGVYMCTSVLFFFSGRTAVLASISMTAAVCGTVGTWIFVEKIGINGAAIGYAFTQGLLALFTTLVAINIFDLPWGHPRQAIKVWMRTIRQPSVPTVTT